MITVWKDGTWKSWADRDAEIAADDPNWLVNIPEKIKMFDPIKEGDRVNYIGMYVLQWDDLKRDHGITKDAVDLVGFSVE